MRRQQFVQRGSLHFPVEETVEHHSCRERADNGGQAEPHWPTTQEEARSSRRTGASGCCTPALASRRTSLGVSQMPMPREATRKSAALPVVMAIDATLIVPVTARPLTTASTIRHSTSSITAAPRMMRASSVRFAANVAKDARRNADAGGGENAADEQVHGKCDCGMKEFHHCPCPEPWAGRCREPPRKRHICRRASFRPG